MVLNSVWKRKKFLYKLENFSSILSPFQSIMQISFWFFRIPFIRLQFDTWLLRFSTAINLRNMLFLDNLLLQLIKLTELQMLVSFFNFLELTQNKNNQALLNISGGRAEIAPTSSIIFCDNLKSVLTGAQRRWLFYT